SPVHLEAELGELRRNDLRGPVLFERGLGMRVDIAPPRGHVGMKFGNAVDDRHWFGCSGVSRQNTPSRAWRKGEPKARRTVDRDRGRGPTRRMPMAGKTLVALYDDFGDAVHAVRALEEAGFQHEDVSLVANNAEHRWGDAEAARHAALQRPGAEASQSAATG